MEQKINLVRKRNSIMEKIGIIGAGSWGTALSLALANNGHSVLIWSIVEAEIDMLKKNHEHLDKLPGVKLPDTVDFTTDIEKTIAYLHDVLEDTDVTVDALRKIFPNEIVDTLITLTHRKDESYFEYIQRVSKSKLAKKVKVADLLHNLDITRIKEPTKQDYERLEKYKKAILYLTTH